MYMITKIDQKKDWLKIKIDKLESIDCAHCFCCNKIASILEFHHCEYRGDDVNATLLNDLILLCSNCHLLLHTLFKISLIKSYDLRNPRALNSFLVLFDKLGLKKFDLDPEKSKRNRDILLARLQSQLPKRKYNSGYTKKR